VKCFGALHSLAQRWMRAASCLCALLAAIGCSGDLLTLGRQQSTSVEYTFGVPERLLELAPAAENSNPTLTADGLDLFYTSKPDKNDDTHVWHAVRSSPSGPFVTPELVDSVSSDSFDTSPAISSDGLTLWLASKRGDGDLDIYVSQRSSRDAAWPSPELVPALNSEKREIPRPPGAKGLIMPLSSDRDGPYWIYLARRASADADFGTPELVQSLADPERIAVDAFLTDDGLTLFFAGAPAEKDPQDLYVCNRSSLDSDFGPAEPLTGLNTENDERDPWLSPDGTVLYFASNREDGILDIYRVSVQTVTAM
jgi:Tol biopolymer transport system component